MCCDLWASYLILQNSLGAQIISQNRKGKIRQSKKRKRKGPPWTRRPSSQPGRPTWPIRPTRPVPPVALSPSLFPRPGSEQGRVPARPPRRHRRREGIRPPRPRRRGSFPTASERCHGPAAVEDATTVVRSSPRQVLELRCRLLLRPVHPVGVRSHRNAHDTVVFLLCSDKLRRRSSPTPATPLQLLNPQGPPCVPLGEPPLPPLSRAP